MKYISEKKITLFYYVAASVLLVVLLVFYINSRKVKSAGISVENSQLVLARSSDVLLDVLDVETGVRGFLLTGKEKFLDPYYISLTTVNNNLALLSVLTKDNITQNARIDSLRQLVEPRLLLAKQVIETRKNNELGKIPVMPLLEDGKVRTDGIRNMILNIGRVENDLLTQRKNEYETHNRNTIIIFFLILLLIAAIFILLIIIRREQKIKNKELEAFSYAAKLASQYSLSLIEASRDPLFTISPAGKITDVNNASVLVTGLSREQLTGSDFFDYFTDPGEARKGYTEVFAKGFVTDFPLTITDGELTDVLFNGSVYKDGNGNEVGAVMVARDITIQNRITKELNEAIIFAELATGIAEDAKMKAEKATGIAEDAVKAKQQFLSNMSHEIRTPMNAIIGFTKVILKTELNVKQKEYLNAIKQSGNSLIVLINDILDLAKVDAGKMTFEQIPFKLESSISSMIHLFETKIEEKNLKLVKAYDTQIPRVLLGDPVRLHQIILNLVSNAVKFTAKGNITIAVKLLQEDALQAIIEFAIADTGIGISESKLETIFENFQQASSGTSRLYGGTGLGLAIVKQLVEAQGGTVTVESKIDAGSTFRFTLTFQKTNDKAESDTELLELDTELKHIKVLVVEDMALNQLLMKTLLDDFGFERDIAANGKIAIEKLAQKEYDIVLMDLQMPEMNGFEATEYIRNNMKSTIPIIALTADVTTVDLEKCKAVGMNDYIAKPVDERVLYSKIIGLVKKPVQKIYTQAIVTATPALKCTDLAYLIGITKNDPLLMVEMIGIYLEQTPKLMESMKQSLLDKDWDTMYAAAHKLIPSFAIMGINADYEAIAKKVQAYAGALSKQQGIAGLVQQLEDICIQACKELQEEFSTLKYTKS